MEIADKDWMPHRRSGGSVVQNCEKMIKSATRDRFCFKVQVVHVARLKVAMELLDHLRRQFAYDAWANAKYLRAACLRNDDRTAGAAVGPYFVRRAALAGAAKTTIADSSRLARI